MTVLDCCACSSGLSSCPCFVLWAGTINEGETSDGSFLSRYPPSSACCAASSNLPPLLFLCVLATPQVMNFYEMRTHRHLRTVAAMDELESARFLPAKQAKLLLGLTTSGSSSDGGKAKKGLKQKQVSVIDGGCHHVLVCGGQSGLLRLFHVLYHAAPKTGKGSNAGHTFSCIPLLALAPSGPSIVHRASFTLGLSGASDKWGE